MSDRDEKKLAVPKFSSFKPKHSSTSDAAEEDDAASEALVEVSKDRDDKKLAVPKFSSFKPKPSSASYAAEKDGTAGKELVEVSKDRHATRYKVSHHPRVADDEKTRRQPRDAEQRKHRRPRSPRLELEDKTPKRPPNEDQSQQVFIIDQKGDPLLRKFGTDRYKAPRFRRKANEPVLGTDALLYIHRDGPREQFSLRQPGESFPGSSVSLRSKKIFDTKTRRIQPKAFKVRKESDTQPEDAEDYLPFKSSKKKTRRDTDSSEDEELPTYRSIEGKAKPHQFSDSDVDYDSDSSNSSKIEATVDAEDPLTKRSIQLTQATKDNPGDISSWLELIDHQNVLLRAGADINRNIAKGEMKSYTEIKVSMYESALPHAKTASDKERLLVGLMREGSKIWNSKTLLKRWGEISKETEASFCLWLARLDYEMSNISTFQYDSVKEMFTNRLQSLSAKASGTQCAAEEARKAVYRELIFIFLRATRFFQDAGYRELAVAAWQAILELNFSVAGTPGNNGQDSVINYIQDFWDSEAPRIGDVDAKGLDHFIRSGGDADAPDAQLDEGEASAPESKDIYKAWAVRELGQARKSKMPGRTLDDGTGDDPFRMIMLSDLEGLLFKIPADLFPILKPQLLDAFLLFCQLPALFVANEWTKRAQYDPFITGTDREFEQAIRKLPLPTDDSGTTQRAPRFTFGRLGPAILPHYVCKLMEWNEACTEGDQPVKTTFVLDTLKQLVILFNYGEIASYYLALEWVRDPTSVRKVAKGLLKRFPNNIDLYNMYALCEVANNNMETARKVFGSATQLNTTDRLAIHSSSVLLWMSWSWLELLEDPDKVKAISRLCGGIDGDLTEVDNANMLSAPRILRCKQAYAAKAEYQVSLEQYQEAALHAQCHALLQYLAEPGSTEPTSQSQGNISAAMATIWNHSRNFGADPVSPSKAAAHEQLLTFAAALLFLHSSRGPYRGAFVSEHIRKCIKIFPRNVYYISLFDWINTGSRWRGEFHTLVPDTLLVDSQDCVSNRMSAIRHELMKGTVHSAQAGFEKALEGDACKHSVALWRCYVRFCAARKELRRKAKNVYYRAIQHCPWSKELAMEAFTALARDMESSDLRAIFNTLVVKGLRIHIDMEEFIEERKSRQDKKARKER